MDIDDDIRVLLLKHNLCFADGNAWCNSGCIMWNRCNSGTNAIVHNCSILRKECRHCIMERERMCDGALASACRYLRYKFKSYGRGVHIIEYDHATKCSTNQCKLDIIEYAEMYKIAIYHE